MNEAAAKLIRLTEDLERNGAWMPAAYVAGEPRGLTHRHHDLTRGNPPPPEVVRFVTEAPELIRALLAERVEPVQAEEVKPAALSWAGKWVPVR